MQEVHKLVQEFAVDLAANSEDLGQDEDPAGWPEEFGTLGEPTPQSPFRLPMVDSVAKGKNLYQKEVMSIQACTNAANLFHASGGVYEAGYNLFQKAYAYEAFRVPVPEQAIEDSPGEDVQAPAKWSGFLTVSGVLHLQAWSALAVRTQGFPYSGMFYLYPGVLNANCYGCRST